MLVQRPAGLITTSNPRPRSAQVLPHSRPFSVNCSSLECVQFEDKRKLPSVVGVHSPAPALAAQPLAARAPLTEALLLLLCRLLTRSQLGVATFQGLWRHHAKHRVRKLLEVGAAQRRRHRPLPVGRAVDARDHGLKPLVPQVSSHILVFRCTRQWRGQSDRITTADGAGTGANASGGRRCRSPSCCSWSWDSLATSSST